MRRVMGGQDRVAGCCWACSAPARGHRMAWGRACGDAGAPQRPLASGGFERCGADEDLVRGCEALERVAEDDQRLGAAFEAVVPPQDLVDLGAGVDQDADIREMGGGRMLVGTRRRTPRRTSRLLPSRKMTPDTTRTGLPIEEPSVPGSVPVSRTSLLTGS